MPMPTTAIRGRSCSLRVGGGLPNMAKPPMPKGSNQPTKIGIELCRWGRCIPEAAAAEMVRVEVATPEPGVMLAGENEQCKLLGIPAHASEIELLNAPHCGVAVTVK